MFHICVSKIIGKIAFLVSLVVSNFNFGSPSKLLIHLVLQLCSIPQMWSPISDLDVDCYKEMLINTCHILIEWWLSRVTFWLDVDNNNTFSSSIELTSNQNVTRDRHRPTIMWHVTDWQSTFLYNSQRLNLNLGTTFMGLNIIGGLNASIILKEDQNWNWR